LSRRAVLIVHEQQARRRTRNRFPRVNFRAGGVAATTLAVLASSTVAASAFTVPKSEATRANIANETYIDAPLHSLLNGKLNTSDISPTLPPIRRSKHRTRHHQTPLRHAQRHYYAPRHHHYAAHHWHEAHTRNFHPRALASDGPAVGAVQNALASDGPAVRAVQGAYAQLGKPYGWGGSGPGSFDCSGLTQWVWHTAGVDIPRTALAQSRFGAPVRLTEIEPGDIVVYYPERSHVGIYVGSGQVIASPHPGAFVQISDLHAMPISTVRRP
jgi:cell wall-associated NlpC family hydrolase